MTLTALGLGTETAIGTANRLTDGKFVTLKKVGVCHCTLLLGGHRNRDKDRGMLVERW